MSLGRGITFLKLIRETILSRRFGLSPFGYRRVRERHFWFFALTSISRKNSFKQIKIIGISRLSTPTVVVGTIVRHGLHTLLLTSVSSYGTSCPDKDPSSLWHARRLEIRPLFIAFFFLVVSSFLKTRLNEADVFSLSPFLIATFILIEEEKFTARIFYCTFFLSISLDNVS